MPELKVSPKGRRYGAFPSRVDHRDYGLPFHLMTATGPMPAKVSLTGSIGPVKNQGSQGSCDGHAWSSQGERLFRFVKGTSPIFAPAFTYYMIRESEGTLSQGDCGGQIVTGGIVSDRNPGAAGFGYCTEDQMPYNEADCMSAPTSAALAAAATFPGGSYHNIGNNIASMKSCIASGYSFVIGIAVYDSFESDGPEESGLIPFPSSSENLLGYHALHCGMMADDTIQCPGSPKPGAIMFQNSWGTAWGTECPLSGERGFAWLPYDFLADQNLCTDVRLSHLGPAWK